MCGCSVDAGECCPGPESAPSSTTKTSDTAGCASEATDFSPSNQVPTSVQTADTGQIANPIQTSNAVAASNHGASTDTNQHTQPEHELTFDYAKVFRTAICTDHTVPNQYHVSDKLDSCEEIHTHSHAFRHCLVTAFDHTNEPQDIDARHAIRAQQYGHTKPYVVIAHTHIPLRQFIQHTNDT
jgi:hypothetical protein